MRWNEHIPIYSKENEATLKEHEMSKPVNCDIRGSVNNYVLVV